MATVSITIPDDQLDRVAEAFADYHAYQSMVPDPPGAPIPNPETKRQFMRARVIDYIRETVRAQETIAAAAIAQLSVTDVGVE